MKTDYRILEMHDEFDREDLKYNHCTLNGWAEGDIIRQIRIGADKDMAVKTFRSGKFKPEIIKCHDDGGVFYHIKDYVLVEVVVDGFEELEWNHIADLPNPHPSEYEDEKEYWDLLM